MTNPITIDLVSDTSTRPSAAMLATMGSAPVGDEQLNEDPTTTALQERVADLLGMEAALFLPSGTMCNQIAYLVHCRPGDEIICAANAHVFGSEGAGASALAGAQFRPLASEDGTFDGAAVEAAVRAPRYRSPRSRVVSVEQTSNRGGGSVWPLDQLAEIAATAKRHGLAAHMDGARLPNAAVASGKAARDHLAGYDSGWIDLSKGLGCPIGGVLAGSRDFIEAAWFWKHRLGGALRQSGILSAAGLYALDHNWDRLAEDHDNARSFAQMLRGIPGLTVVPREIETNIVFLELGADLPEAPEVARRLAQRGIRLGVESPRRMRAVTHLDVSRKGVETAAQALIEIFT